MINYRVDDLDGMLAQLRRSGAEVADQTDRHRTASSAGRPIRRGTGSSSGSRRPVTSG